MASEEGELTRLAVDVTQEGDTAMVKCSGKLVAGVTDFLYKEVSKLIPHSKHIVLDLTDLSYMDSMGLGTLVRLLVTARAAGSRLELINLGKRVRQLMGITNLLDVFQVCGEHTIKMP